MSCESYQKQNFNNEKILGINLGNVLKDKRNESLPSKTKLDQTRSDIVGNLFYKLNLINFFFTEGRLKNSTRFSLSA